MKKTIMGQQSMYVARDGLEFGKFWVLRVPSPDPINSGSYGSPALTRLIVCLSVCLSVCKGGVWSKTFYLTTNFSEFFCGERSRGKTNLVFSKHFD